MRPPMPWFNLKAMSDRNLLAIYRFLLAAGQEAPATTGAGEPVATPYIDFTPKYLPSQVSAVASR